jgi:hypothetical protein
LNLLQKLFAANLERIATYRYHQISAFAKQKPEGMATIQKNHDLYISVPLFKPFRTPSWLVKNPHFFAAPNLPSGSICHHPSLRPRRPGDAGAEAPAKYGTLWKPIGKP